MRCCLYSVSRRINSAFGTERICRIAFLKCSDGFSASTRLDSDTMKRATGNTSGQFGALSSQMDMRKLPPSPPTALVGTRSGNGSAVSSKDCPSSAKRLLPQCIRSAWLARSRWFPASENGSDLTLLAFRIRDFPCGRFKSSATSSSLVAVRKISLEPSGFVALVFQCFVMLISELEDSDGIEHSR